MKFLSYSIISLCFLAGCASPRSQSDLLHHRSYSVAEKPLPNSPAPKQDPLIYLDPGHGGQDVGTSSRGAVTIQEKMLALETAKLVQGYLKELGYRSRLTRSKDIFIPLKKRAELANRAAATIFVSLHYNSAPNSTIRGAEVFYYKSIKNKARSASSRKLAESILHQLQTRLPTTGRGVKHEDFCVIRETTMTAVLVEAAFLSNPKDAQLLRTRVYKQRIAKAIAMGVDAFFKVSHTT